MRFFFEVFNFLKSSPELSVMDWETEETAKKEFLESL